MGLSAAEAEPDPNRNHTHPTLADTLAELGVEMDANAFRDALMQRGPGLVTGGAGGYGGLAALAMRGPSTTMFFPVEPPVSLSGPIPQYQAPSGNPESLEDIVQRVMAALAQAGGQASAQRVPVDLLGAAMNADDVRTLLDFGATTGFSVPPHGSTQDAIRALLDLPTVSLSQWNQRHSSQAAPVRTAASANRQGRRLTGLLGRPRRLP